ncbi:MAG: M56 family metallopeptidase [Lachnospiraceae bacterium]|nr:M56 family metallopeptidase [Lachnospiraceae bacterium]
MNITIFSFIMSVIWCDIFAVMIYVFFRKKKFIIYFNVLPILFLISIVLLRLLVSIEFSFTKIIHSDTIFLWAMRFFKLKPFQFLSDSFTIRIIDICFIIWVFGIIFFLCKNFIQDIHFKYLMSKEQVTENECIYSIMNQIAGNRAEKIRVIETTLVNTPMIAGLMKPTIYLPKIVLSDKELYNILLHEWTHYIHKDIWIKFLLKLLCTIYWWNPFLYLLKHDIDDTLEVKCDLSITTKMTENEKTEYLESILKVAKSLHSKKTLTPSINIGFITQKKNHSLKERFNYILEYIPPTTKQKISTAFFFGTFFLFFLSSYLFVIQPYAAPPKEVEGIPTYTINPSNSYIIKDKNEIYSLYIDGQFINIVTFEDIQKEPFVSLKIIETEE